MASSPQPFFLFLGENRAAEQEEQPPQNNQGEQQPIAVQRTRKLEDTYAGVDVEVVALTPEALLATDRFLCHICSKGFQRDQNLQLHLRAHNAEWRLIRRPAGQPQRRRVYVCPEPTCVHHEPGRALGDLTGIKKHYSRKHGDRNRYSCRHCGRGYAVLADVKAHEKTCIALNNYTCPCGALFRRRDSFKSHKSACNVWLESKMNASSLDISETVPTPPLNTSGNNRASSISISSSMPTPYQNTPNRISTSCLNTSDKMSGSSLNTSNNMYASRLDTYSKMLASSMNTSDNMPASRLTTFDKMHASSLNISDSMLAYPLDANMNHPFDGFQSQPSNKDDNDNDCNIRDIFSLSKDHPMLSSPTSMNKPSHLVVSSPRTNDFIQPSGIIDSHRNKGKKKVSDEDFHSLLPMNNYSTHGFHIDNNITNFNGASAYGLCGDENIMSIVNEDINDTRREDGGELNIFQRIGENEGSNIQAKGYEGFESHSSNALKRKASAPLPSLINNTSLLEDFTNKSFISTTKLLEHASNIASSLGNKQSSNAYSSLGGTSTFPYPDSTYDLSSYKMKSYSKP